MNSPGIHDPADAYAEREVQRLFEGRKGHGGGPCTKRVLRPAELKSILRGGFLAGTAHQARATEAARFHR